MVLEVLNKVHHKVKASSHLVGAQEELTLKPRHLPQRHPRALQVFATRPGALAHKSEMIQNTR